MTQPLLTDDAVSRIVVVDGQPYGYYNPAVLYQKHLYALSSNAAAPSSPEPQSVPLSVQPTVAQLPTGSVAIPAIDPYVSLFLFFVNFLFVCFFSSFSSCEDME